MKVIFAAQMLADWATPASGFRVDGKALIQETDIIRSLTKTFRYRGNESLAVEFDTLLQFPSVGIAKWFALTNWTGLTKQGICQFYCGTSDDDSTVVSAANAVLLGCSLKQTGAALNLHYSMKMGGAAGLMPAAPEEVTPPPDTTFWTPPPDVVSIPDVVPATPSLMTQLFEHILAAGDTTWAITFGTPFTAVPSIPAPAVIAPSGGDNISAYITSRNLTGCSGNFSAPIPASGYQLSGSAIGF